MKKGAGPKGPAPFTVSRPEGQRAGQDALWLGGGHDPVKVTTVTINVPEDLSLMTQTLINA